MPDDYYAAQQRAAELSLCPEPSTTPWPPDKWSAPGCSAAILARHGTPPTPPQLSSASARAAYRNAQAAAAAAGECPPPEAHTWVPDATLYPQCARWVQTRCVTVGAAGCNVPADGDWSDAAVREDFAEAQNWVAARGTSCPPHLFARWAPGAQQYPRCQAALADHCRARRGYDCAARWQSRADLDDLVAAQRAVHAADPAACPSPDEYLWETVASATDGPYRLPSRYCPLPEGEQ